MSSFSSISEGRGVDDGMWVTPWWAGGMGVVTSLSWSVTVGDEETESNGFTGRGSAG